MNARIPYRALPLVLLAVLATGCGTQGNAPPLIALDEPIQAQALPEPPKPIEVVTVPEVLPLPAQIKPLPKRGEVQPAPEPADEKARVARANAEARVAPTREGYVNAIQVWPYTDGALYQVYAAPGRVTAIALQPAIGADDIDPVLLLRARLAEIHQNHITLPQRRLHRIPVH